MASDMKTNGFDPAHPIEVVIYDGEMFVVDGHHRLAAAKMARLKDVPVRVTDDIASHKSSFQTVAEVVRDAANTTSNRLRHKGKLLPF